MSKEYLEAIERIKNKFINFFHEDNPDVEAVEDALQRLESIDNANPSEALDDLDKMANQVFQVDDEFELYYNKVKQALLKAQEQEKVLSIIKEKNVDIEFLKSADTFEEYNRLIKISGFFATALTEDEFDLLKRWLG